MSNNSHSDRPRRSPLRLVLRLIAWTIAAIITLVVGYIALVIVFAITALALLSLWAASYSEDVTTKYWVLLGWTIAALLVTSLVKFVVLVKKRKQHQLRWDEYIGHTFTTGVLSGGLAFGGVTVLIAALGTIGSDIESIAETDMESRALLALLAIVPLAIGATAVWLTVERYIAEIPESRPPDKGTQRMIRDSRAVWDWVNRSVFRRNR